MNYVLLYLTNCNFSPYHYRRKRQDLYGRFSIITPGHYSWRDYLCSSLLADTYFKWNCDIYKYRPSRFSYAIFFWTYRPIQRFSWRNHMPEVFDSSLTVRILWCLKKSTGILQINFRNIHFLVIVVDNFLWVHCANQKFKNVMSCSIWKKEKYLNTNWKVVKKIPLNMKHKVRESNATLFLEVFSC